MDELRDLIKNFIITIPFAAMLFVAYGCAYQNDLNASVYSHTQKARQEQRVKLERDINTLLVKSESRKDEK